MMILALTGPMGSGKSTVIELIQKFYGDMVPLVKFAQPLYDMQKYIYSRAGLEQPKTKDRKLLQWLGTEWGRGINLNLWGEIFSQEVARLQKRGFELIVCDDCRFDNEAERIKAMGGRVIKLEASPEVRAKRIELIGTNHASEAGVSEHLVDAIVNNDGDMEKLAVQVKELVTWFCTTNDE